MANEAIQPVHFLTIPDVSNSVAESPYAVGGYWLSKRRDGRSANWMIARWQPHNKSIVYKSCRTTDLGAAKAALNEFADRSVEIRAPIPNRRSSSVYFIQAETGQIKIGRAFDVGARQSAMRTMSPVPLTLLCAISGDMRVELGYHKRFAEHRLHGEWFAPHPDILAEIARLSA